MKSSKAKENKSRSLSLTSKRRRANDKVSAVRSTDHSECEDPTQLVAGDLKTHSSSKKVPKTPIESSPVKFNRTITDWVRNPDRERSVRCPICNCKVLHSKINSHLDSECVGPDGMCITSQLNNGETCDVIYIDKESEEENNIRQSAHNSKWGLMSKNKCTTKNLKTSGSTGMLVNKSSANQEICIIENVEKKTYDGNLNTNSSECTNKSISDNHSGNNVLLTNRKTCSYIKTFSSQISESDTTNSSIVSSSSKIATCEPMETSGEASFEDTTEADRQDPYYLANFKLVLDTVLSNEEDRRLFNEADLDIIMKFQQFPIECQKLYIRLFQRKSGWFRCSKLDYPKIAKDLNPVLRQLQKAGFLETEKCLTDLSETLKLLPVGDLKEVGKSLRIIDNKSSQKTKDSIIETFIKHGKTQRTLFGDPSAIVLKRAKSVLGSCVRVSPDPKFVFLRVLLLFTMNIIPEDEDNKHKGQSQQLSTIFLANIGKLQYPEYNIIRELKVFEDRDYMIEFTKAYQDKHEMSAALEVTGDLELAYSYYPNAAERFKAVLDSLKAPNKPFSANLPVHLRCFSSEWVYAKMCYLGVEVLQKTKRYNEAVDQLQLLLQQDVYCADCRGQWWERLALNTHQHLKQPLQALEISKQGLEDSFVRFGRRLALVQRVKKILSSASFKKKNVEGVCHIDEALLKEPNPAETITIQGKRSEQLAVFISPEVTKNGEMKEDTVTFLSVEEYALSHYRQEGYDEGIHGETSTFTTLYGLLFWDIIFLGGIPDVFRAPFQASPLDLNYDTFYEKRKALIDDLLEELRSSSTDALLEMIERSWTDNNGRICAGVSWERFSSLDQVKQFVSCIGGKVLSGIFTHFAQDMRHWHSGMPDLVVWNSSNLQYRIVEVKGPGDRLSTKQEIWLSELASFGATVEVCYVTAVGGRKKLMASTCSDD